MRAAAGGQGGGDRTATAAPFRWWPVLVMAAITLVDRIDTYVVAGVLPLLQAEWGFSDTAAGMIPLAVAAAGLAVALPAGYLADRVPRTRLLAVVVASWSLITLGSGLAPTFAAFFATRVLLGAADSLDTPAQSSLLGDYYAPLFRARVYGLHRMVYFAGAGLGALVGGVVGQLLGWRAAFFVIALPGLLVAWCCWRLREPDRGAADRLAAAATPTPMRASAARQTPDAAAVAGRGWRVLRAQIAAVWGLRTIRMLLIGVPVLFVGVNGFVFWLPSYLARSWGIAQGPAGTYAAVILMVGVVGGTLLGAVLGRRWHGRVPGGRVLAGAGGLLCGSVALMAGLAAPGLAAQVAVLTVALALLAVAVPTLFAAAADCLHHSRRGIGFALLQVGITLGGSLGPLAVGAVSDATGSLSLSLYAVGTPTVLAGLIVLAARSSYERDAHGVLTASAELPAAAPAGEVSRG